MSKSNNRKYIQLYHDSLVILEKLTDEQAGILLKAIYQYSQNNEKPNLDFALDIAITPFINQIDREQERNLQNADIYRENGRKGGRPKKNQNNQSGFLETKDNQNNQLKPITTTITNTITTNNTITKTNTKHRPQINENDEFDIEKENKPPLMNDKTWELFKEWWNLSRKQHKLSNTKRAFDLQVSKMKLKIQDCYDRQYEVVQMAMNYNKDKTWQNINLPDDLQKKVDSTSELIRSAMEFA